MSSQVETVFRREWGRAVAVLARLTGDLGLAEDAVADAFAMAVDRWAAGPLPSDPAGWLIAVAKNHAVDQIRHESRRPGKEEAAARLISGRDPPRPSGLIVDERLRLIFACCHPALDPGVRVALTLRTLCGLSTAQIARAFLVGETTMAQRLVRAKRKIRDAAIPFRVPAGHELPGRTGAVLRVVYLVFTEGHRASAGPGVITDELCDEAIRLARLLAGLRPGDPEVLGLLALLLLTDARRPARATADGRLVLLPDQDRGRWDRAKIGEGTQILDRAMSLRRPGPYQLQAAIAACHATATDAGDTDWAQIAALYAALASHEPTPVVHANRAVAVAMAEGPAAGLAILDELCADSRTSGWHLVHACRAGLLRTLGRTAEAGDAYRAALALDPPPAERDFLCSRLSEISQCPRQLERTTMPTAEEGIEAQVRNIEARYGKTMPEWFAVIAASGLSKHTEVVAMLKAEHGLAHGAAHRVSLLSRQAAAPAPVSADAAVDALYTGKKASLRPLHDRLMTVIEAFGPDVTTVPKKGYLSIRRKKQFAMIQPSAAGRVDVGLILRDIPPAGRLEAAGSFNALFTHRVRVASADDIDTALTDWLHTAYVSAG